MKMPPPYTVAEVAHMTGYSKQTVTRLFENEPGVHMLERKKKNGKRRSYRSIRIPRAVYERVVRKITRVAY
jgi:DNA-binding transcriptional regulator GbsR (MarR family)